MSNGGLQVIEGGSADDLLVYVGYAFAPVFIGPYLTRERVENAVGDQIVLFITPEQKIIGVGGAVEPHGVANFLLSENNDVAHITIYAKSGSTVASFLILLDNSPLTIAGLVYPFYHKAVSLDYVLSYI